MTFNSAEFEFACGTSSQLPQSTKPEVIFSGKSNVGKSSLINKLCGRKALARISSKPGKTATINFFEGKVFVYEKSSIRSFGGSTVFQRLFRCGFRRGGGYSIKA